MGCDIHVVIEEKVGDKWIGVVSTDRLKSRPLYAQRDSDFFGAVASVRNRGGKLPMGIPYDVSDLSWYLFSQSPTDHHSASHMPLGEFCAIHNRVRPDGSRADYSTYDVSGIFADEAELYRVVFWFDN